VTPSVSERSALAAPRNGREIHQHVNAAAWLTTAISRGIRGTINTLLKKHEARHPSICEGLGDMQRGLKKLRSEECLSLLSDPLSQVIRGIDALLTEAESADRAA
jgi:hypothetical protein